MLVCGGDYLRLGGYVLIFSFSALQYLHASGMVSEGHTQKHEEQ
jgi:hypothetical protein